MKHSPTPSLDLEQRVLALSRFPVCLLTGPLEAVQPMVRRVAAQLLGVQVEGVLAVGDYEEFSELGGVDSLQAPKEFLQLRPLLAYRIALLENLDKLTVAAQNHLLKALEEPFATTKIFIHATQKKRLLDTLRSRVVHVDLRQPLVGDRPFVEDMTSFLFEKDPALADSKYSALMETKKDWLECKAALESVLHQQGKKLVFSSLVQFRRQLSFIDLHAIQENTALNQKWLFFALREICLNKKEDEWDTRIWDQPNNEMINVTI